jgi:hypothetical protein
MSGVRLLTGVIVMAVVVPLVLAYLLSVHTITDLLAIVATCLVGWGVADLVANILSRPRLRDRSPAKAIRQWEQQKRETPADGETSAK